MVIVLFLFAKKKNDKGEGEMMSPLKKKFAIFIASIVYIVLVAYILMDQNNYEKDGELL